MSDEMVVPLLWLLAGGFVAYLTLPSILYRAGFGRTTSYGIDDPDRCRPSGDERCADLCQQLLDLGFEPLGLRVETSWLFIDYWRKVYRARIFYSPKANCYATLSRTIETGPWKVCLCSCLEGGGLLETNGGIEVVAQHDSYFMWGFTTADIKDLLALHEQVVTKVLSRGHQLSSRRGLQSFVETELAHERLNCAAENHREIAGQMLSITYVTVLLLPLIFFGGLGLTALWLPAGIIVFGLLYLLFHYRSMALDDLAKKLDASQPVAGE